MCRETSGLRARASLARPEPCRRQENYTNAVSKNRRFPPAIANPAQRRTGFTTLVWAKFATPQWLTPFTRRQ